MVDIQCVVQSNDRVGEVPVWCNRTNLLWWIDVRQPRVQSYDPITKKHEVYLVEGKALGSWALRENGGMILAQEDGIYAFDPKTGKRELLIDPEADKPDNRLNDGRCDRLGRYWLGSMNDKVREPDGIFYSVTKDLETKKWFDGIVIPNGVAFSPDDRTMYFADTPKQKIWAFDFDLQEGVLSNRRLFVDLEGNPGRPDGSIVDAEGFLWNAEFNGGRIVRYAPNGSVDRIIEMPVTNITCIGFGGEDYTDMYVTTAWQGLSDEKRKLEPNAGGLFRLNVGVKGIPEPRFAG